MLKVNKLMIWKITVKNVAYIDKKVQTNFAKKVALVQRCTSNPG